MHWGCELIRIVITIKLSFWVRKLVHLRGSILDLRFSSQVFGQVTFCPSNIIAWYAGDVQYSPSGTPCTAIAKKRCDVFLEPTVSMKTHSPKVNVLSFVRSQHKNRQGGFPRGWPNVEKRVCNQHDTVDPLKKLWWKMKFSSLAPHYLCLSVGLHIILTNGLFELSLTSGLFRTMINLVLRHWFGLIFGLIESLCVLNSFMQCFDVLISIFLTTFSVSKMDVDKLLATELNIVWYSNFWASNFESWTQQIMTFRCWMWLFTPYVSVWSCICDSKWSNLMSLCKIGELANPKTTESKLRNILRTMSTIRLVNRIKLMGGALKMLKGW